MCHRTSAIQLYIPSTVKNETVPVQRRLFHECAFHRVRDFVQATNALLYFVMCSSVRQIRKPRKCYRGAQPFRLKHACVCACARPFFVCQLHSTWRHVSARSPTAAVLRPVIKMPKPSIHLGVYHQTSSGFLGFIRSNASGRI